MGEYKIINILVVGNVNIRHGAEAIIARALNRHKDFNVKVILFPTFTQDNKLFNNSLNQALLEKKYDIVLCGKVPGIDRTLVRYWRSTGVKFVQWVFDLFYGHEDKKGREEWYQEQMPIFDLCLGAEGSPEIIKKYNKINTYYCLREGIDPKFHFRHVPDNSCEKYKADVMFCGQIYNVDRIHIASLLKSMTIRSVFHTETFLEELSKAASVTKLAVNTNYRNDIEGYWSARTYEMPGCGVCTLQRHVPGLEKEFKDMKTTIFWNTLGELKEKIYTLLENREFIEKIRRQSYEYVHKNHTMDHRIIQLKKILKKEGLI